MAEQTSERIRVELGEPLAGHHILLDPEEMTFGLLEDLQSQSVTAIIDGLARAIVGGDLPKGVDRAGIRRLKPAETREVIKGVRESFAIPKSEA